MKGIRDLPKDLLLEIITKLSITQQIEDACLNGNGEILDQIRDISFNAIAKIDRYFPEIGYRLKGNYCKKYQRDLNLLLYDKDSNIVLNIESTCTSCIKFSYFPHNCKLYKQPKKCLKNLKNVIYNFNIDEEQKQKLFDVVAGYVKVLIFTTQLEYL